MYELSKRVSYLKGLAEGLGLNEESKEEKILSEIIDILDEMAEVVCDNEAAIEDLEDYIFEVDEDLSYLEDDVYGDDYEDYEDDDDYGYDFDDDYDFDYDDDYFEYPEEDEDEEEDSK